MQHPHTYDGIKPLLHGLCGLLLLLTLWTAAAGQETREVVISDDEFRQVQMQSRQARSYRSSGPDTLPFSPSQPFFDDFSRESLIPDTNLWFLGPSLFYPLRTVGMAVNPPTRGVLTFDGADAMGEAYETLTIAAGPADILFSHYIDLAAFGPANNVQLSFALQPQGRGNRPETADSFLVRLVTSTPDTVTVYSRPGSALQGFRQVLIPLDDPAYFHSRFQMIFENKGSLNGYLDHWHLDYVYLGANRPANDTSFNDLSAVSVAGSPIAPYTAMPYEHYQGGTFMRDFQVNVSNLSGSTRTTDVSARISDPVGGSTFSAGSQQQLSPSLAPFSRQDVSFQAFGDQVFAYDGVFQLDVRLPLANDDHPENDQLTERYRIDSIFAYDDGEADAAYGLNKPKGFGARYDIGRTDSLSAVWISFVPLLNFNPSSSLTTYMKDKAFRLVVWFDSHPDSVAYAQVGGTNIRYGNVPDHFERYPLSRPVVVSQRFWVGLQQLDELPVGVGLDLNNDNGQLMYWDSLGFWKQSQIPGSLMIRPELIGDPNRQRNNPTSLDEAELPAHNLRIFPNPLPGETLSIDVPAGALLYEGLLMDIQGKVVGRMARRSPAPQVDWELPTALPDGLYLLRHTLTLENRTQINRVSKVLLQRNR